VTPDNGTLTLIAQSQGIEAIREIDETKNRRPGSGESYTFSWKGCICLYCCQACRGCYKFRKCWPVLPAKIVTIDYQQPVFENNIIKGNIPVLDIQYGNVWTNIDKTTFAKLALNYGDNLHVSIYHNKQKIYEGIMPYVTTFSAVAVEKPVCYLNSLLNVSFALNKSNFSEQYKVYSGAEWSVEISK
jgi:S-adenosylmethionine hydrolase